MLAVVVPSGRDGRVYAVPHLTYRQLDRDSDEIACLEGRRHGAGPGRSSMVRPGLDFFSLVFAVFKAASCRS